MGSIFISYSRSDRAAIGGILSELNESSQPYWLDESDILPTMQFNDRILDGLAACQWFLIVMTPRSAASEYVKDELHWALTNRNGHIIPVMLEKCDPATFHLRMLRIQYVNLTPDNKDGQFQLQRAIRLVQDANDDASLPLNNQRMDGALEMISLLLTFIPRYHQKHLCNLLAEPESGRQAYVGCRSLRHELRDLCTWGLLNRCPDAKIGEQARDGLGFSLHDVVVLTDLGRRLASHVS